VCVAGLEQAPVCKKTETLPVEMCYVCGGEI